MGTEGRREKIIEILKSSNEPIKGTVLASNFDVSRQVIVQDIAILRAEGVDILATSMGYMLPNQEKSKMLKTIVTRHFEIDQVEDELMTIINNGGKVIDVLVNHPIYGKMRGVLNLSCKVEVEEFLKVIESGESDFLSNLTGGVHIHTIEVPSNDTYIKIKNQLKEKGYLVKYL